MGRFLKARKLIELWVSACASAAPYLRCAKFGTLLIIDLTLANDSQTCCESVQKKFRPIRKSQETFTTLGACLRMRCPLPRVPEVRHAFTLRSKVANDSQASFESAEKVWADS